MTLQEMIYTRHTEMPPCEDGEQDVLIYIDTGQAVIGHYDHFWAKWRTDLGPYPHDRIVCWYPIPKL